MTRPSTVSPSAQRRALRVATTIARFAATESDPYELDGFPMRRVRVGSFVAFISAHCAEAGSATASSQASFQLMVFPGPNSQAIMHIILRRVPDESLIFLQFDDGPWIEDIISLLSPDRVLN